MAVDAELEAVYDAHAQALYGFALNLTRNEEDTKDVLQEVFIKLARDPSCLGDARNQRHFLLRMTHNAAIDLIRRREAGRRAVANAAEHPANLFASVDDPDAVLLGKATQAALAELPPEQRAAVHLKLWEGMTFEQIASVLNIPVNTAASRYRYGLDKLKGALRPIYDEII